jgi:electron transport complex protein RnfC
MAANPPAPAAPPAAADDGALKKAKIDAAMLRAQLRKLERLEAPSPEQQAELPQLRSQLEAAEKLLASHDAQAPAAAPVAKAATDDGALKKAKIDAAMLKAQLRKLEKLENPDEEQQTERARVRQQLEAAEKHLIELETQPPAPAATPVGDEALKKAKIDAAMLKAQLRKLEKLENPDDDQQAEIAHLRQLREEAEKVLASLQQQPPAALAKPAGDEALKKAKIELAMKRAELKKAEKAGSDDATLDSLRSALAQAEQALHQAEDASAKPAPELVRTDKQPIDETTRALKTEVAFARADLRKLERDDSSAADALSAARQRLTDAESKLQEHAGS